MRIFNAFIITLFLIILNSCRKDFDTIKSTGDLSFSKDTIYLDTVFSNIGSSTRNFRVYNKSNSAITIPTIALARGEESFYRLNVDGISGKTFESIDILANDSIFIFVEATIDFSKVSNPIYTDSIVFDADNNFQDVDLVTLVQDATFYFPERDADKIKETIFLGLDENGDSLKVNGRLLKDNELVWTNEKSHVVYGYVGVPENKTLTIDPGAKINFHKNSGIIVFDDATLKVNGQLGNEVVFEGDRLEPDFAEVAGQWGAIWLRTGSKNHEINYAIIKNSAIGILVDDRNGSARTLKIKNSQIYNSSNFGILGRNTNILGENLVIANAGQSALACTVGGIYDFKHATFANYWRNSFRQFPAVLINNFSSTIDMAGNEEITPVDLVTANFTNCIIAGSQNIEFLLDKVENAAFNFKIKNSMLRFETNNMNILNDPLFDFTDVTVYQNIILNGTPNFQNVNTNNLIIGEDSEANGNADFITALSIPLDILGFSRTISPDIGAYQHIIFEEDN